jgi:ankyrin repeat protein
MNDSENLKRAIQRGNTPRVKSLLEYGRVRVRNAPNTNTLRGYFHHGGSNGLQDPPVSIAVEASIPLTEKKKIIKLLLQHGANINSKDLNGFTAIHKAIEIQVHNRLYNKPGDDVELVRFLIQHGAKVNVRSTFRGVYPLNIAVEIRKYNIARLLVEKGANINSQNESMYTPLHYVISYERNDSTTLSFVRFLLDHGANPNTKIHPYRLFHPIRGFLGNNRDGYKKGWTPLHTASDRGHAQLVRLLLERGARPNTTDSQGMTPLHVAVKKGHSDVVKELLRFGANISATSKNGSLALDMANKKNIKNMIIKERDRRRLYAIGSLNRIKKHGTKNTIHVPNNIKFQILSKTGLFNFNNTGSKKTNIKKRKRNNTSQN